MKCRICGSEDISGATDFVEPLQDKERITFLWLRSMNFRLEYPLVQQPHMIIWTDARDSQRLELSPTDKTCSEWHCWFRNDCSHNRVRFIHVRRLHTRGDVRLVYWACAGKQLEPDPDFALNDPTRVCKWEAALEEARKEGAESWHRYCAKPSEFLMRWT